MRLLGTAGLFVVIMLQAIATQPKPSQAASITIGTSGPWVVMGDDVERSCLAARDFGPGQFNIGVDEKKMWLTFQNFSWILKSTPTNTMSAEIAVDGQVVLKSFALIIVKARALQVFMMPTDPGFWHTFFSAHLITIRAQFYPGSGTVQLENPSQIIPMMKSCADRYLKDVPVPF